MNPMQAPWTRSDGGQPPAKRVKGNPIITRYPPPPGYAGPGRPPAPYQQQPWQGHAQAQAQPPPHYGNPTFNVQPPQDHLSPYGLQPAHWNPPHQPSPPAGLSPLNYASPQAQAYPPPIQTYPPSQTPWQYPPSASSLSTTTPHSLPTPHPWSASTDSQYAAHQRRPSFSITPATETSMSAYPLDGNGDPLLPPSSNDDDNDEEESFWSECYYNRHPDEVNPDFSLGVIEWKPPVRTKHALPATFNEAELETVAPRRSPPEDEESVSDYFVRARRDEALMSVRQITLWDEVRDELIFRNFATSPSILLSLSELLANYRDRHDRSWMLSDAYSSAEPTPEPAEHPSTFKEVDNSYNDQAMDLDFAPPQHRSRPSSSSLQHREMPPSLERQLSTNSGSQSAGGPNRKRKHSRASSTSSLTGQQQRNSNNNNNSRPPKVHVPVRNQKQEDILAALGVTGSPKTVYETPGPAFGAVPSAREGSVESHSRKGSTANNPSSAWPVPPPPPPHPPSLPQAAASQSLAPSDINRPNSSHSAGTAVGSDFQFDANDDDIDPTPKAARNTASRKRSLEDIAEVSSPVAAARTDSRVGDGGNVDDDGDQETPKPRRKAPRVQDAYRRRW